MKVYQATEIASVKDPSKLPETKFPEVAFAGRSNVGKSSLMNALLFRQKPLAPISKRPGRTRSIDFYFISDKKVVFVDLPGYGYAAVPGEKRALWQQLVEGYISNRIQLAFVIILVDARRGLEQQEWELVGWLQRVKADWFIVFTKADRLKQNERKGLVKAVSDLGYRENVHYLLASAKTKMGIHELWELIDKKVDYKRASLKLSWGF